LADIERELERSGRLELALLLGGTVGASGFEVTSIAVPGQQRGRYETKLYGDDVQSIVDAWRAGGIGLVGLCHTQPGRVDLSCADLDLHAKLRRGFGLRYLLAVVASATRSGWEVRQPRNFWYRSQAVAA
jgi:hypothetical protein